MRVGLGLDAHSLVTGKPLVLGGIAIPYPKGLEGHSDGDVLTHAIIDALLGAATMGDIGTYFPSDDPQYCGISSTSLLAQTVNMLDETGWRTINVDATIVAQAPKLAPYIGRMRNKLSDILKISIENLSIKATTTDGMGFTGRGEGLAVQAISLLEQSL